MSSKTKAFLVVFMFCLSFSAMADRERFSPRPHPDAHWHSDLGWLVPAIVGGALIYGIANSRPEAPMPQVATQPGATSNYSVQPGQPQQAPYGYHWEQILDANCNCYRVVLVKN